VTRALTLVDARARSLDRAPVAPDPLDQVLHRLVEAAGAIDARTHFVVLSGGDAGLRRGEMLGLRWSHVDFKRRQLQVEEAVWEREKKDGAKGHNRVTDTPKAVVRALCR
jgi:integrase